MQAQRSMLGSPYLPPSTSGSTPGCPHKLYLLPLLFPSPMGRERCLWQRLRFVLSSFLSFRYDLQRKHHGTTTTLIKCRSPRVGDKSLKQLQPLFVFKKDISSDFADADTIGYDQAWIILKACKLITVLCHMKDRYNAP